MGIKTDLEHLGIDSSLIEGKRGKAGEKLAELFGGILEMTRWTGFPEELPDSEIDRINSAAEKVRSDSDYFIVMGAGGSFLGAKAVIDMLAYGNGASTGAGKAGACKVRFLGHDFSARAVNELIDEIGDSDFSICPISKSGGTAEIVSIYGVMRDLLEERYGKEEAAKRTYFITGYPKDGDEPSFMYKLGQENGSDTFEVPDGIGGRYSVLSAVGLLPIACAGIDIRKLLDGARDMTERFKTYSPADDLLDYAIVRHVLGTGENVRPKEIEVYEFFDPFLAFFGEWLKQLFGESEGKEGKGIFPASLVFSRDLHSMGQFLQQGSPVFFETVITADRLGEGLDGGREVRVPDDMAAPFGGKTFDEINESAIKGVVAAHADAGTPIVRIVLDELDTKTVGALLYWFEVECAVSVLMLGVDPFNQPGVEDYKRGMREAL